MKKEWLAVVLVFVYFMFVKEPTVIKEPCVVDTHMYVEIKGEVVSPGVYEIVNGTRIFELIDLAGGITEEANIESISLSNTLHDADTVRIPSIYDVSTSLKININTATLEQLLAIPGLGQVKSEAIIQYRTQVGSYQSLEELMNINGIGESTYHAISPFLVCE